MLSLLQEYNMSIYLGFLRSSRGGGSFLAALGIWSSRARGQIQTMSATYATAAATLDPQPTVPGQESNLHPGAAEMLPILLCHSRNSLGFLLFLWSTLRSFQHTNPMLSFVKFTPKHSLFLSFFLEWLLSVSLLNFGAQIVSFVYKTMIHFCMFVLYPVTLLNSIISSMRVFFFFNLWDFLNRQRCHLQTGTALFLPFRFVCLLFPFPALLHWLELPVLGWMSN